MVVTGRKGRGERRKGPSSSKAYHFCHKKVIGRMTATSARVAEKKG